MESIDRKFLEDNIINFQTIEHGYTRNLYSTIGEYERIYKKYVDAGFIPTRWCPACVFNMMKRLKAWYERQPKEAEVQQPTQEPKRRRK
jgi:hypothetical protein